MTGFFGSFPAAPSALTGAESLLIEVPSGSLALSERVTIGTLAAFQDSKVRPWARRFAGVQDRFGVMASPPTVTMGVTSAASTINGHSAGVVSARWDSGKVTNLGASFVSGSLGGAKAAHITVADGSKGGQNCLVRSRAVITSAKFGAVFRDTQFAYVGAIIDGQYVARSRLPGFVLNNSGNSVEVVFDFGANTPSYALRQATKSAGGSGYVVGDTITLAGGTASTAAVLKVIQVSAGAVSLVDVVTPGSYSVSATALTQASTSGVGTGATFTTPIWEKTHTTYKPRKVELLWHGSSLQFIGFNINESTDSVMAWPASTQVPRLVVIGDSITAGTYLDYAGAHMGASIAQMLGLWDNLCINAIGGTGWITVNASVTPNGPTWSDPLRVADYIAQAGDIYLICGSQNDGTASAALTAAVTSVVNQIHAALPNALIVGIGPWVVAGVSAQPLSTAIGAGYAAIGKPAQQRYIDNVALGWLYGTGKATAETGDGNKDHLLASDGVHPHQAGLDDLAQVAAPAVADAILQMVGAS